MGRQYAHLHAMAKTSVKFQNDWPKTVGGIALTIVDERTDGRVTARLYRTCVLMQVRQKERSIYTCKISFLFVCQILYHSSTSSAPRVCRYKSEFHAHSHFAQWFLLTRKFQILPILLDLLL